MARVVCQTKHEASSTLACVDTCCQPNKQGGVNAGTQFRTPIKKQKYCSRLSLTPGGGAFHAYSSIIGSRVSCKKRKTDTGRVCCWGEGALYTRFSKMAPELLIKNRKTDPEWFSYLGEAACYKNYSITL